MIKLLIIPTTFLILSYVFLLSLKKPKLYMWLYLLASTQFMGFVDFAEFEIQGVLNVLFYLNVITIFSVVTLVIKNGIPNDKSFRFLFVIAGVTGFGFLYPVLLGYSNISSSITDGKDFLCYFFLAYLLLNKDTITTDSVYNVLTFIGLGLSIIVIIATTTGLTPPAYLLVQSELGPKDGIHIAFSTFISLAFFLQLGHIIKNEFNFRHIYVVLVLLIGVILQPHRSIFFGLLAGAAFVILYRSSFNLKIQVAFAIAAVLGAACIFMKTDALLSTFVEPVQEVLEQTGAIGARKNINYFRWEEIRNRPLLGHGFINESSEFGESFYLASGSRFSQTLGTIDSGYVDTLVRFGIVGTIIILIQYIGIVTIPFRIKNYGTVERLMPAVFFATYFIISFTWSVFTYKHGIIPAAIAIYLIVRPKSGYADTHKNTIDLSQSRYRVNTNRPHQPSTIVGARSLRVHRKQVSKRLVVRSKPDTQYDSLMLSNRDP
jgi:hypothetical protein